MSLTAIIVASFSGLSLSMAVIATCMWFIVAIGGAEPWVHRTWLVIITGFTAMGSLLGWAAWS